MRVMLGKYLGFHTILFVLVVGGFLLFKEKSAHAQYPGSFTLSGRVFVDTNSNGIQDGGEVGYSGGTTITAAFVFIPGSFSTTTDASGNYSMFLPEENYNISLTVPAGYSPTTPSFIPFINIGPLNPSPVINFGIVSTPLSASCSGSPNPATAGTPMTWTAVASGGVGGYSYSWSDGPPPDDLSGTSSSVTKTYSTLGPKSATVTVTSGAETRAASCSITVLPPPSWFKTVDGDVHSAGGISQVANACGPHATWVVTGGTSASDFKNFDSGAGWRIAPYTPATQRYDYDYFNSRLTVTGTVPPTITDATPIADATIYKISGDVLLESSGTNFAGKSVVVLVDGNLIIGPSTNSFNFGSGAVAFLVRGTISINPTVTTVRGIFLSNGIFSTGISITTALSAIGTWISHGSPNGFSLQRMLGGVAPCVASEIVTYDPQMLLLLTNVLGQSSFYWQEVAP